MSVQNQHHDTNSDVIDKVVAQRERFVRFLTSKVEDEATAEDILQAAYVRAIERGSEIREGESAVAWFYRILRNAVIDHYRRRAFRMKAQEALAATAPASYEPGIKATACQCIADVIANLKPEYRTAIEQVDLRQAAVENFARLEEITPNNASVRLHRARKAVATHLKTVCGACAEHKCLDCTCRRRQL